MKKLLVLFFVFLFFSCNESSSISIMQGISTSQVKSDKVWRQAEIVRKTGSSVVDCVLLTANDGLYAVDETTDQDSAAFLKVPSVANNATISNADGSSCTINGQIRNIYVPSNYDSVSNPYVIFQTVSSGLLELGFFYRLKVDDLSNLEVVALESDIDDRVFMSRSLVQGSRLLLFCSVDLESGKLEYSIGNYKIEDETIDGKVHHMLRFDEKKTFSSSNWFYDFWEDDSSALGANARYLLLFSTSGDDIMKQEYYLCDLANDKITPYSELSNLAIRFAVPYPNGTFMAITQGGSVIHSSSTKSHKYTSDSSFSYNRYTPPVVFRKVESGDPDITVFARYNSNGFIIYSYRSTLDSDNKIYDKDHPGHIQTTGFAEDLRAEDISELQAVDLGEGVDNRYRILVLSTENGVSTYKFDSIVPLQMKANGSSRKGLIDFFE